MTANDGTAEWVGRYSAPGSTEVHETHLSVEDRTHWQAYLPTVMAVIDSGAVDEFIYEIAAVCHQRHIATGGRAASARPHRPVSQEEIRPDHVSPHLILSTGNPLPSDENASPYFSYSGKRYGKQRAIGRYFTNAAGEFVRIGGCGTTTFTVDVVGGCHPSRRGVTEKVHYSSVPHLFGA